MSQNYKSPCGCEIHVIKWTARSKSVSVKSCPMHKNAGAAIELIRKTFKTSGSIEKMRECQVEADHILAEVDGVV